MHSVLHLDGKFWRTLPMLAWRPGELTRRYAHGERAKFISPLALFLFTVFLMFAVFSFLGAPFQTGPNAMTARQEMEREATSLKQELNLLESRRKEIAAAGRPTTDINERISDAREELQALETTKTLVLAPGPVPEGQVRKVDLRDSGIDTGWDWLDAGIEKARKNPDLLLYKVQANAYKFSWTLIPLSLPFVWVMFLHRSRYRREFSGYDHLVFVTYSIAFMSLAAIVLVLLGSLEVLGSSFNAAVGLAFILIPPFHMFRQLRGAYSLSRFSAAWRTAFLLIFANTALGLFALMLLSLGVIG